MASFIENLGSTVGMGAATEAASGILGIGLGAYNDNRQEIQSRRLQGIQIAGQKEMTDYNMQKQLQMWKDTSYPAQMEQLKKAGLNPGLLYGMGGAGGGTTGEANGNVTGQHAEQNPGEIQGVMGIGLQSALLQAQIDNIKADTAKKLAEAPTQTNIRANLDASTGLLTAQTSNTEANTALTKMNTKIAAIQKEIAGATKEEQIKILTQTAANLTEETNQLIVKTQIDRATQNTIIDTARANLIGVYLKNSLTKVETAEGQQNIKESQSRVQVNDQEIMNMAQEIVQKWAGLKNQSDFNAIQKNYTEKLINLGIGAEAIEGVKTILGAFGRGGALQQTPTRNPIGYKF